MVDFIARLVKSTENTTSIGMVNCDNLTQNPTPSIPEPLKEREILGFKDRFSYNSVSMFVTQVSKNLSTI